MRNRATSDLSNVSNTEKLDLQVAREFLKAKKKAMAIFRATWERLPSAIAQEAGICFVKFTSLPSRTGPGISSAAIGIERLIKIDP